MPTDNDYLTEKVNRVVKTALGMPGLSGDFYPDFSLRIVDHSPARTLFQVKDNQTAIGEVRTFVVTVKEIPN